MGGINGNMQAMQKPNIECAAIDLAWGLRVARGDYTLGYRPDFVRRETHGFYVHRARQGCKSVSPHWGVGKNLGNQYGKTWLWLRMAIAPCIAIASD